MESPFSEKGEMALDQIRKGERLGVYLRNVTLEMTSGGVRVHM